MQTLLKRPGMICHVVFAWLVLAGVPAYLWWSIAGWPKHDMFVTSSFGLFNREKSKLSPIYVVWMIHFMKSKIAMLTTYIAFVNCCPHLNVLHVSLLTLPSDKDYTFLTTQVDVHVRRFCILLVFLTIILCIVSE